MTRLLAQAAAVVTVGVLALVLVLALPVSTDGVAVLAGALMVGAGALRRAEMFGEGGGN